MLSFTFRTIEGVYKEHCEKNSKEQPKYLDSSGADDLVWTDSPVWEKVRTLAINLYFVVLLTYNHEDVKVGYRAVSSSYQDGGVGFPGKSDRGQRSQEAEQCGQEETRGEDRKETLCASYMSLIMLCLHQ